MSWPPTLFDSTDFQAEPERFLAGDPDTLVPGVSVRAPCCGRVCGADMVVDLRGLAGTRCCPGGQGQENDLDFACDGCRWRICRECENGWCESKLQRALGAPSSEVRHTRAQERARERRRELMEGGGEAPPFGAIVDEEVGRLGDGMPEGTDPPDVE